MTAGCEVQSKTLALVNFKEAADNATDEELRAHIAYCNKIIQQRQTATNTVTDDFLSKHFKYLPNFLSRSPCSLDVSTNLPDQSGYDADQFMADLRLELESLGLENSTKKMLKLNGWSEIPHILILTIINQLTILKKSEIQNL